MRVFFQWWVRKSTAVKHKLMQLINRFFFLHLESLHLGKVVLGKGCRFHSPVRVACGKGSVEIGHMNGFGYFSGPKSGDGALKIQPRKLESQIVIGDKNWFNNNVTIIANEKIEIGNGCRIGDDVAIYDCDFHEMDPNHRGRSHGPTSPVSIGDNVWLGSRVMVLKGVQIGENSVVGAMSLVTKSIPANCIAAGIPAKVIKSL